MKKIVVFSFFIFVSASLYGTASEHKRSRFFSAFSAGYAFKHDCEFKKVYGHGMANIITADGCYYPWKNWGVGMKTSYWRAKGRTTFLKRRTHLYEVPITFYLRAKKAFQSGLDMYASLGGGVALIKEKSYLGKKRFNKGIGEVEVGLVYPVWRCVNLVGAFRYLFPHQSQGCDKVDVGGFDLRAGIGFSF